MTRWGLRAVLAVALLTSGAAYSTPVIAADAPALYQDATQPIDARVEDFLNRLTLEEKISLLHADSKFSTAGFPRFDIPKRWMSDGPQGVREEIQPNSWNPVGGTDDLATAMPADIGLAASFDPDLAKAYGDVIGEEALARGKQIMLCPAMNIFRTPLNGRNCEYLGEDPFLAARMAVGFINGVQSHGVAACAKHYAANNQETNRGTINVEMDDRALHEIYLPAFKAAVTEAHVWAVMSAYNKFRGDYCSQNDLLLNQILKKDWGFTGLVMSDWSGTHSTIEAAKNGLDLEMGTNKPFNQYYFADPLLAAVNKGDVPQNRIDEMARRNLRVMFATGMFDPPTDEKKKAKLMTPAHIDTARRVEESAIVLLKNQDRALPLDSAHIKSIAVLGDIANVKFAHDGNSAAMKTSYEITPLEGIKKAAGDGINVSYVQGYAAPARGRGAAPAVPLDDAVAAAKSADVAIVFAGLYRAQDQEGADRRNMDLPAAQVALIQAVAAANPRTIVVLTGGGPVTMDPWLPNVHALLQYWYGGTEGGNALANILFGKVNPSGKLPCTFPKLLTDSPAHAAGNPLSYPGVNLREVYDEGILVGYRWFDAKKIDPQFPFGFGLSYTTFECSDLHLTEGPPPRLDGTPPKGTLLMVNVSVANTGTRDGAEVVQVYVENVAPRLPRPPHELKAFRKVQLKAGEKTGITIPLDFSAFSFYDPDKKAWLAEAGDFKIHVGTSSRDLPLEGTYKLLETITQKEGE